MLPKVEEEDEVLVAEVVDEAMVVEEEEAMVEADEAVEGSAGVVGIASDSSEP